MESNEKNQPQPTPSTPSDPGAGAGDATISLDQIANEARDVIITSGKRDWKFLRSVWFWVIAGPVNILIALVIIAWGFPQIFLGYPDIPKGYEKEAKFVYIDLNRQAAYGYEKGKLMHRYVILTGTRENATPPGTWRVTKKDKAYHSKKFDVPMPYSVFFVEQYGIAMHYSFAVGPKWCLRNFFGLESEIGSHGCVRLTPLGSISMFKFADIGTTVLVK